MNTNIYLRCRSFVFVLGPDPNFNPNLFSEDEEDSIQPELLLPVPPRCSAEGEPPLIAPMTPRTSRHNAVTRPRPLIPQSATRYIPTNENLSNGVSRSENFDDSYFPAELQDVVNYHRSPYGTTIRITPPPRCCEVPALQSPKNAVAPTQTLIATSSPNATLVSENLLTIRFYVQKKFFKEPF